MTGYDGMDVTLDRIATADDAEWCARLMSESEPWMTLGRSFEASLALVTDPTRESYVARRGAGRIGFVVLCLIGPMSGYLQSICVVPEARGRGAGTVLLALAEERIFATSPNAFLCVSGFNDAARRLYERAGYVFVGELPDFLVAGHSELLYRKTRGPWHAFVPA